MVTESIQGCILGGLQDILGPNDLANPEVTGRHHTLWEANSL